MVNTPLTDRLTFHCLFTQRSADWASHSGESETVFVSLITPCSTRTRSRTLPLTCIFKAMGGYSGVGDFSVTLLAGIPTTTIGRISVAWDTNAGTNQKAAGAASVTKDR